MCVCVCESLARNRGRVGGGGGGGGDWGGELRKDRRFRDRCLSDLSFIQLQHNQAVMYN